MQKLEQLFFDSVDGSRLPFFPAEIDPQLQRYVQLFRPIEPPVQSLKPRRSGQAFLDRMAKGRMIEQLPLPESPKAETAFMSKIRYRLRKKIRPALIQILTKPKNSVVRQYQKLFEFENVKLKFSDDALDAIAEQALQRKVGARGLRMILEELMLDLMYYMPSYKKVREFVVTKEMVLSKKINWALLEKAG